MSDTDTISAYELEEDSSSTESESNENPSNILRVNVREGTINNVALEGNEVPAPDDDESK